MVSISACHAEDPGSAAESAQCQVSFDRAITNEQPLLRALENAGVLNPQLVSSADTSALERARARWEFEAVGWRFCSSSPPV